MVRLKAKRVVNDFLSQIGHENIIFLVQQDRDLVSLLKPEVLAQYRAKAAQNAWICNAIGRQDVVNMIDTKLIELLNNEPNGQKWLVKQLDFLQSLFGG